MFAFQEPYSCWDKESDYLSLEFLFHMAIQLKILRYILSQPNKVLRDGRAMLRIFVAEVLIGA